MSSDMIMGVMQAANASKAMRAQTRLAQLGGSNEGLFGKIMTALGNRTEKTKPAADPAALGDDLIAQVMAAADPAKVQMAEAKLVSIGGMPSAVADASASPADPALAQKREAAKKLEGALLASVVDDIIPKDSATLYGEGTSGNIARQFQVEALAEAAAATEPLGLANQFYGNGAVQQQEPLQRDQQWPYFGRSKITPYAA